MSLTKGERNALRWLLAVTVTGAVAQLYRNWRHADAVSPVAAEALSRQLLSVDSAQRRERRARSGGRASRRGRASGAAAADSAVEGRRVSRRRSRRSPSPAGDSGGAAARAADLPTLVRVDVDRADVVALERLPRIGPALAARIVADREARGAYGSLEALQRVRGIGPKLAAALSGHVTFSGIPRPSTVQR